MKCVMEIVWLYRPMIDFEVIVASMNNLKYQG